MVLALNGPAPLAKLLTQRLRRKRAGRKATRAEEAEAEEFLSAAADDDDAPPSPSGSLNSLHLTPGSPLMRFVADALEYFICARLEGSAALKRVQWELSGADVPGEGELKLLSRLRSHWWGPADGEGVGGEGRAASTGSSSSSSDEDEVEEEDAEEQKKGESFFCFFHLQPWLAATPAAIAATASPPNAAFDRNLSA